MADSDADREAVVDDIDRLLVMLLGARMAAAQERMADGAFKEAALLAGEATGYRRVQRMLDGYRETGELPEFTDGDHWAAYEEVAEAMIRADEAVNDVDDGPPGDPGWQ